MRPEQTAPGDAVPGTVYLVVDGGRSRHSQADILLVPRPSADLNDPLRWNWWRKHYHLCLLVLYSVLLGAITNAASPVFDQLLAVYKTSSTSLNIGFAFNLLMLGVANVVLIPLSNKYGRRPVYLASLLVVALAAIWQGRSTNIAQFQCVSILLGIGAAPVEALVALSISDIFFTHERGAKISYYVYAISFGTFIGPVAVGYIDMSQGWQWVFYWAAILSAIFLVVFFFTFEESHMHGHSSVVQEPQLEQVDSAAQDLINNDAKHGHNLSLQRTSTGPRLGQSLDSGRFQFQYKLWHSTNMSWKAVVTDMWLPLRLCTFPAILWCGVFYGTCVSWLQVLASTVANVFSPPPYLFSNPDLGLFWIGPMIGSIIGILYCGPLNDRFVVWRSRHNSGFREAEFLLWCCIPTALITPAGLMLYGIASARGLPWIIPVVGAGLVGFGLAVGGEVSISYTIDCYKMLDTQAITTIILIRNIIGFAVTWAIQPWILAMGQQGAFVLCGVLSFVVTGFVVIVIIYGKKWRIWTRPRYEKLSLERS